jgi:hypothetical protein
VDPPRVDPPVDPIVTDPIVVVDPPLVDPPLADRAPADPAPAGPLPVRPRSAPTTPGSTRQGRCVNHPGAHSVGTCQICGRRLCISCAVLVRGAVVGKECFSAVLEDAPATDSPPAPLQHRGDWPALAGFGFVVLLSVFPWARFGGSGFFDAWRHRWSLVAVAAAVAGLAITLVARRRQSDPMVVGPILAVLALIVGGAAVLAFRDPPPLTEASSAAWLAVIGAVLALIGSARKAIAGLRTRGPAS